MKIVAWLLFACCAINIANVEAGGKSLVIYIKDGSYSNDLESVEVDKEFYSNILQQIKSKNKKPSSVKSKMNDAEAFLEMVSGGKCKCQCMCCTTPPPLTPTPTPPTGTPPPPTVTTPPPTVTTPPPTVTTPPPTVTTPPPTVTTPPPTVTTPFQAPTYLPPTKGPTTPRISTSTRTYQVYTGYVLRSNFTGNYVFTPRSTRSTTRRIVTTTPTYAYYAPANQFYYPGEGLSLKDKRGKPYYAVEPVDQNIAPPKAPKSKWNFFS